MADAEQVAHADHEADADRVADADHGAGADQVAHADHGAGAEGVGGSDREGADPLRFSNWMRQSATGAVMTGIARGFHRALEAERQLPAFVMEAPDEPEGEDGPIELHFDPDDPTKTVAIIREPRPDAGR